MSTLRARLEALPGIGELSPATLDDIVDAGREVHIPEGWTPVHQQEPADKAYVILSGHLCVIRDGTEIAQIAGGELAGEMGLVDLRLRNAQLTATDSVEVLAWPREAFQVLRERHADFDRLARASAASRRET